MKLDKILHLAGEGGFFANTYMLELPSSSVVIDPAQALFNHAAIKKAKRVQLFATHGHFDHVYAVDEWRDRFDCDLAIHEAEQKLLCDSDLNASYLMPFPRNLRAAERLFKDGERIDLGDGYRFEIVHTSGHTKGSSCFLLKHEAEKDPLLLFSGDTLFRGSVGRSDLPTGNPNVLEKSLEKLLRLSEAWPEEMPVYAGHGLETTFRQECLSNPWLR